MTDNRNSDSSAGGGLGAVRRALEDDDLAAAREVVDRLLAADPSNPGALYAKGQVHFEAEEYDRAEAAWLALLDVPCHPSIEIEAISALGDLYRATGRFEEAERRYLEALAAYEVEDLTDGRFVMHVALGELHKSTGRPGSSFDHFRKAIALGPSPEYEEIYADTCHALGSLLAEAGDKRGAEKHLKTALKCYNQARAPDGAAVSLDLGNHYFTMGRIAKAREHLTKTVNIARNIHDAELEALGLGTLSLVQAVSGKDDLGTETFKAAIELAVANGHHHAAATISANLGQFCEAMGDLDTARGLMLTALELFRATGDHRAAANLESRIDALGHA